MIRKRSSYIKILFRLSSSYNEEGRWSAKNQLERRTNNLSGLLTALKTCSSSRDLKEGKKLHLDAIEKGCDSNIYVATSLVDMYAKCGIFEEARKVFDGMKSHDVVSWNALLQGYAKTGEIDVVLDLFSRMEPEGCAPNALSYVAALQAIGNSASRENEGSKNKIDGKVIKSECLRKGIAMHARAAKAGFESHLLVSSTLMDMYAKCGSLADASMVFRRMPRRDVVSWTSLILGYVENDEPEGALEKFTQMTLQDSCQRNARTFVAALMACSSLAGKEQGREMNGKVLKISSLERGRVIHAQAMKAGFAADLFVANTLVDMYSKCGSMVEARDFFERMPCHSVVSWTALILGYAENEDAEVALDLYRCMTARGCVPNARTYIAVLTACGNLLALETGTQIHADIRRSGREELESDQFLRSSVVDFYAKCGSMALAREVFQSRPTRDIVTWNAMIAGYSRQGDTSTVFELFETMRDRNLQPNGITMLCLLTACSHAGLVDKGKELFQSMLSEESGIKPGLDHYHCMIDLLGRANHLEKALAMIENMPYRADAFTWTTLLGGAKKWKNLRIARIAFDKLVEIDDKRASTYVLMASLYGSLQLWEERSEVLARKTKARAWKIPGQSFWTDQAGRIHKFVVGSSHAQHEEIQAKLRSLTAEMKREYSYVADLASVSRNIGEAEKEESLCGHSERLAIACAFINTPPGTAIRIAKNLRVCDDCHRVTVMVSAIEKRRIVCRDASRFHVFEHGQCSCGDFW